MTRAKFTTNPFEEYSAVGGQPKATGRREDAPKEFIDAIAGSGKNDAPAVVEWLAKNFPVAGYKYEVESRDKIKISGFGVSKIFTVDPNIFVKNKTRANEIWKFMFDNYDTRYTLPEIKATVDLSNLE